MPPEPERRPRVVIVTARDEAERIQATIGALAAALPGARIVLAESGSCDATAAIAARAGAEIVRTQARRAGKGRSATTAARAVLALRGAGEATFLLCDGDLGASAAGLAALVHAVEADRCDLAVAAFVRSEEAFGFANGFARWAIRDLTDVETRAPISGQRALRGSSLEAVLPLADGFGMEIGMTVDALRAGLRLEEIEIDLEHRATTRSIRGFAHRGRQLAHIVRTYVSRRRSAR